MTVSGIRLNGRLGLSIGTTQSITRGYSRLLSHWSWLGIEVGFEPSVRLRSKRSLKLDVTLRIDQPVDPLRGGHREPHRHQLAGRRSHAMLGRLAMQMGA